MNSIDRNQPEDNDEDLQGQEAVKKIKEMVEQAEIASFAPPSSWANHMGTAR